MVFELFAGLQGRLPVELQQLRIGLDGALKQPGHPLVVGGVERAGAQQVLERSAL